MLNVLLVDDDYLEIEALRCAFDWEALGFAVLASALSGEEALRICAQTPPDVLITDLIMPGVNGMQLAAKVRETHPDTHIIFISGHEDFSAAQSALEIQIDGYLLKPLEPAMLLPLLQKISGQAMHRRIQEGETTRLMRLVQEARPLLREHFWLDVLQAPGELDEITLLRRAQTIGLPIRDQQYLVVAIKYPEHAQGDPLQRQSALQTAAQSLSPYDPVRMTRALYAVVLPFSQIVEEDMILQSVERFAAQVLAAHPHAGLTLGSSLPAPLSCLNQGYAQALQALEASFQFGSGQLYWYEEPPEQTGSVHTPPPLVQPVVRQLEEALAAIDAPQTEALTAQLFTLLHGAQQEQVQSVCMELISFTINHFRRYDISPEALFGADVSLFNKLLHMETIVDIRTWMQNVLRAFVSMRSRQLKNHGQATVEQLLHIIEHEYMQDLSLPLLAERVGLTQGYMCRAFKNRTGQSILTALTERRMQVARSLLLPGSRVSDVAAAVGFSSVSYFCKVFHDVTGVTPGEYRK